MPSQTWMSERSQTPFSPACSPSGSASRKHVSARSSSPRPRAASPVPGSACAGDLRILLLASEAEGLLPVVGAGGHVPSRVGHGRGGQMNAGQHRRGQLGGQATAGPLTADRWLAAQPPVQPHRPGDPARGLRVAAIEGTVDGHQNIGLVVLDAVQPEHLVGSLVSGRRAFGQVQDLLCVGAYGP